MQSYENELVDSVIESLGNVIEGRDENYSLQLKLEALKSLASYKHNGRASGILRDLMHERNRHEDLRIAAAKALSS